MQILQVLRDYLPSPLNNGYFWFVLCWINWNLLKKLLLFSRNPMICYALKETLLKIDFLISKITLFTWTINSQRFNYSVSRYESFPLKAQCIGSEHPFRQWLQTNKQYKLCEYVLITFSQFPNTWQSGSQSDKESWRFTAIQISVGWSVGSIFNLNCLFLSFCLVHIYIGL